MGRRKDHKTSCLKSKKGNIMDSRETLKREEDYIRDLYYYEREEVNIENNNDGPYIY